MVRTPIYIAFPILTILYAAWIARYPAGTPSADTMPQEWKDALATAESAGLIPNLTLSNSQGNYPKGINAGNGSYCNSATQCRADGDIWDAPDGMLGVSFDDVSIPWNLAFGATVHCHNICTC